LRPRVLGDEPDHARWRREGFARARSARVEAADRGALMSRCTLADGVYTVVPTPFTAQGALDLASLRRLIEFLVEAGVEGLLVLGVMGEAPKLLPDER